MNNMYIYYFQQIFVGFNNNCIAYLNIFIHIKISKWKNLLYIFNIPFNNFFNSSMPLALFSGVSRSSFNATSSPNGVNGSSSNLNISSPNLTNGISSISDNIVGNSAMKLYTYIYL